MGVEKIVSYADIREIASAYRTLGRSIVFTNGCFDILHAGHVTYLEEAARQSDILMIGLNSDRSVATIKGQKRPVINERHRARVLAALEFVDHIVLFDAPDPHELIEIILPDVLVKGADWSENEIVGADIVKAAGGRVERVRLLPEISTTRIIEKIVSLYCEDN
jgi:rfaE bifunctional protein nucleotidyltransferase chain/domain